MERNARRLAAAVSITHYKHCLSTGLRLSCRRELANITFLGVFLLHGNDIGDDQVRSVRVA
jgi:hypothetical protein